MRGCNFTSLAEAIKSANIAVYEDVEFAQSYEAIHRDVFNSPNQARIARLIQSLSHQVDPKRYLDIGCGTGNVLKFATRYFKKVYGVDYSLRMLVQSRKVTPLVAKADGLKLPFRDESFDCISFYSVLHHILDPVDLLREAFRTLRKGGIVYTDHDPNIYFMRNMWWLVRIYNFIFKKTMFAGEGVHRLAEYHHKMGHELDPVALMEISRKIGFSDAASYYRPYYLEGKSPLRAVVNLLLKTGGKLSSRHMNYYFYMILKK